MISPNSTSNITSDIVTSNFSIEVNESMFTLLTSRVYSDPMSAAIREWSTNAIDACIAANLLPQFDVHIPTITEPFFSVRDYGTGLSEADINGLFSTLGASTKRESNAYNGSFGIGRMSGLAYATSFVVDSFFNGSHFSYLISIQNGVPVSSKLLEQPTTEANGLRLTLPVLVSDIPSFQQRAEFIYRYFDVRPSCNVELPYSDDAIFEISDEFFIDTSLPSSNANYVLMANVMYAIPYQAEIKTHSISRLVMRLPNGSVAFNPGRESLSLTPETTKLINDNFVKAFKQVTPAIQAHIDAESKVIDKLRVFSTLSNAIGYSLRSQLHVTLPTQPYHSLLPTNVKPDLNISNTKPNFMHMRYLNRWSTRSKDLTKHTLNMHEFAAAKYIVADTPGNTVDAAVAYFNKLRTPKYSPIVIILSRPANVKLDAFLDNVKAYFDNLGIDEYALTSQFTTSTAKTVTSRPDGVYVCQANNSGFCANTKAVDTNKYWYLPIIGSNPIDDINMDALMTAFKAIPSADRLNTFVVGVQKKYIDNIPDLTNFTPALEALQSYYDTHQLNVLSNNYANANLKIPTNLAVYPSAVKEYLDDLSARKAITSSWHVNEPLHKVISSVVATKSTYYDIRHSSQDIVAKYPILYELIRYRYQSDADDLVAHYLKLEAHYESTAHSDG